MLYKLLFSVSPQCIYKVAMSEMYQLSGIVQKPEYSSQVHKIHEMHRLKLRAFNKYTVIFINMKVTQ